MKISSENFVYSMSAHNQAAASCKPGETVIFECQDCFSNQIQSEEVLFESTDWDTINPATGPLKVEGAEIGDTLKVEIKKIELNNQGVMVTTSEESYLEEFNIESKTKIMPIKNKKAIFNDKIKFDLKQKEVLDLLSKKNCKVENGVITVILDSYGIYILK